MVETIRVQKGDVALVLAPELGGAVASFTVGGVDVLRPASDAAIEQGQILGTAGFPMIPYSGRINQGKFTYEGRAIELPKNFPPEPHAIHGDAWQKPWRVVEQDDDSITLVYRHDGSSGWPWPFVAEQEFVLNDDGLTLTMRCTNKGDSNMPVGMGWHSYFPRQDGTLQANVESVWTPGPDMIPAPGGALYPECDITSPRVVDSLNLDHPYSLPDAKAVMAWPSRKLIVEMISSANLGGLVVYIPPGQDFYCCEPASNAPDAVNSGLSDDVTGLVHLAPGDTFTTETTLKVTLG